LINKQKYNFTNIIKTDNLGTTVKKNTAKSELPAYTSSIHQLKGNCANLNKKTVNIQIKEKFIINSLLSDKDTNKVISLRSNEPINPYTKDTPNKNTTDIKEPYIKYFNPASIDLLE